jgi:hypothetical protein
MISFDEPWTIIDVKRRWITCSIVSIGRDVLKNWLNSRYKVFPVGMIPTKFLAAWNFALAQVRCWGY